MTNQSRKTKNGATPFERVVAVALILLVASIGMTYAQSGGAKDTKKLREKVDAARKSIQSAEDEVKSTMQLYNSLMEQNAKKPENTYKKLASGVESSDKSAKAARKQVDAMRKDLEKFYTAWEKEVAGYTTEAMKEQSQNSLNEVKAKFERFDTALNEASELYQPFIASLRDQVSYLGRDLSPEAVSALETQAKDLNENASKLYEKVDEILNDTKAPAAEEETAEATDDQEPSEAADDTGAAEDSDTDPS